MATCPEGALGQNVPQSHRQIHTHTNTQEHTHAHTSTYTVACTPRLYSAARSAPRPWGNVKELPRPQRRKRLGTALSEARNPGVGLFGT